MATRLPEGVKRERNILTFTQHCVGVLRGEEFAAEKGANFTIFVAQSWAKYESSGITEPTPTQREDSSGPLDFVSDGANRMNFVELRSQIQQMRVHLRMIMDRSQQCSPMTARHCCCLKLAH